MSTSLLAIVMCVVSLLGGLAKDLSCLRSLIARSLVALDGGSLN